MATQRKAKSTGLEEIKAAIRQHKLELKNQFHVDQIGVFGSYARGTQKKGSDVDYLVSFEKAVSYLELAGLKLYIDEITGLKSDVIPIHNLKPEFRDTVYEEIIYI